jgi:hypothetical protein
MSGFHAALPKAHGAITGGLVQLVQQKLCSALAEIDGLKQDDMWRAAHAIARLTQAAISLQRWSDEMKRRAAKGERNSGGEANAGGGLSAETSQALRNALLGIARFDPEHIEAEKAGPARSAPGTPPGTANAEQFHAYEEAARAGPSEPAKKINGLDDPGSD